LACKVLLLNETIHIEKLQITAILHFTIDTC